MNQLTLKKPTGCFNKLGTDFLDVQNFLSWFTTLVMKTGWLWTKMPKTGRMLLEKVKMEDTLHAMESLVEKKLVRSNFVPNFSILSRNPWNTNMMLSELLKTSTAVNQVEYNPYFNHKEIWKMLLDITIEAYSLGAKQILSWMMKLWRKMLKTHKDDVKMFLFWPLCCWNERNWSIENHKKVCSNFIFFSSKTEHSINFSNLKNSCVQTHIFTQNSTKLIGSLAKFLHQKSQIDQIFE